MSDMEKTSRPPVNNSDITDALPELPHVVITELDLPQTQPSPDDKKRLLNERIVLIGALVFLLVLFWGFLVATAVHPIIISNTVAAYLLWSIPKNASAIFTPISTVFTILVGLLYARSMRIAAQKSLTRTLKIRSLVGWNALMGKRLLGMPFGAGTRWAKFALLSYILLWSLTTGFNAFITPQIIIQYRSLPAFGELDMSSDAFLRDVYAPISQDLPCRYGNYSFFTCSKTRPRQPLLLLNAGESSAFDALYYPVTTNFAVASFNGTSEGVMPTGAYLYSIWFADNSSHPFYNFIQSHRTAAAIQAYTISYQQQGLSADVTCDVDQSSPLSFTANPGGPLNSSVSFINPTISCDGINQTPLPQQTVGADFLLVGSCADTNQTQRIYLRGFGAYQIDPDDNTPIIANMTCQLDPIFTTNDVSFDGQSGALNVVPVSGRPAFPNSATSLISDIVATLIQEILEGQSETGNTFVDVAQSLALANTGLSIIEPTSFIVQSMFKGMFEVSGLAINGYWSSKLFTNVPLETLVNSPYTRRVDGILSFPLYGWNGDASTIAGLIPFTIISIIALVMLVWTCRGDSHLPSHFDPSDPLHLMVASAAGDFGPLSDVNIETDNVAKSSTRITYTKVNGRWVLTDRSNA